MKTIAAEFDFPFVASLPASERKSALASVRDVVEEAERVFLDKGPVLPQGIVAEMLGLSRQRVWQLVNAGRLEAVEVGGQRFVLTRSLRTYQKGVGGRPRKASFVQNVRLGVKAGLEVGKAMAKQAGV